MSKKSRKPKKISYRLIERESESGKKWYPVLELLVSQHHEELRDAKIALAWNLSWKADVDGRVTLGKCKKASELDRELAVYDFVIILRRDFFESPSVTDHQRRALLDHELCHASVTLDGQGHDPVVDERGRIVYRTRKHDLEEFKEIVDRYGTWKKDLEVFAQALDRARAKSANWIGYRGLRERLIAAGAAIPLETIIAWNEDQRREADVWANVKNELERRGVIDLEIPCPSHVDAAKQPTPLPLSSEPAAATH